MHGAKGLQHYQAWESVIDREGNKGKFFDDQKQIHSEFKALGNTLMALESTLIYHSDDLLPGCPYMEGLKNDISESGILGGTLPKRCSAGEFADAYGNKYIMILNRDYEKKLSHTFTLADDYRIYEVSRVDGEQNVLFDSTREIKLDLAEGDAILLRVQPACEEAFACEYKLVD